MTIKSNAELRKHLAQPDISLEVQRFFSRHTDALKLDWTGDEQEDLADLETAMTNLRPKVWFR